jgi:hypothetical protein
LSISRPATLSARHSSTRPGSPPRDNG